MFKLIMIVMIFGNLTISTDESFQEFPIVPNAGDLFSCLQLKERFGGNEYIEIFRDQEFGLAVATFECKEI